MARRSLLTAERREMIAALLESGEYPSTIVHEAGISARTFWRWRQRGEQAQQLLDAATDPDHPDHRLYQSFAAWRINEETPKGTKKPYQARTTKLWRDHPDFEYWQFWHTTKRAEAIPVRDAVVRIRAAGQGGQLIEERTVTRPDGTVETVRKFARPQWQALMTYLSRRHRTEWAPSSTVEVRPQDQGDEAADPVQEMLHQLATLRAERQGRLVALHGTADDQEEAS